MMILTDVGLVYYGTPSVAALIPPVSQVYAALWYDPAYMPTQTSPVGDLLAREVVPNAATVRPQIQMTAYPAGSRMSNDLQRAVFRPSESAATSVSGVFLIDAPDFGVSGTLVGVVKFASTVTIPAATDFPFLAAIEFSV